MHRLLNGSCLFFSLFLQLGELPRCSFVYIQSYLEEMQVFSIECSYVILTDVGNYCEAIVNKKLAASLQIVGWSTSSIKFIRYNAFLMDT